MMNTTAVRATRIETKLLVRLTCLIVSCVQNGPQKLSLCCVMIFNGDSETTLSLMQDTGHALCFVRVACRMPINTSN
eukprot:m.1023652 g.1023652  ORF g.1023652 m.1023652 type:complete len:77 (+) comp24098_c0_seq11:572-802(+)